MSQHLDSLAIGDTIDVKGPVGHFVYEGRGKFSLNRKPGFAKCVSCAVLPASCAGGAFHTPRQACGAAASACRHGNGLAAAALCLPCSMLTPLPCCLPVSCASC